MKPPANIKGAIMQTRRCYKCDVVKSLEEFAFDKFKNRRISTCRSCRNMQQVLSRQFCKVKRSPVKAFDPFRLPSYEECDANITSFNRYQNGMFGPNAENRFRGEVAWT